MCNNFSWLQLHHCPKTGENLVLFSNNTGTVNLHQTFKNPASDWAKFPVNSSALSGRYWWEQTVLLPKTPRAQVSIQHPQDPTPPAKGKPTRAGKTQEFKCNTSPFLSDRKLSVFPDDKTGVSRAFQQVNYQISSRIAVLKRLGSEALNVGKH